MSLRRFDEKTSLLQRKPSSSRMSYPLKLPIVVLGGSTIKEERGESNYTLNASGSKRDS